MSMELQCVRHRMGNIDEHAEVVYSERQFFPINLKTVCRCLPQPARSL